ncbi:hypothetical protein PGTUg99_002648 [Puccinia graminis f. sp. tritici]|uniref:Uncharacterized protein n=2 Tax=Puccinia graminis f. sp. tritici TaxID=56615 RepID=A0A5B0M564_PUCGR|nr:hypothetical protein PGTUg99_002648 [Puccinia graminis f. sp. tritici]
MVSKATRRMKNIHQSDTTQTNSASRTGQPDSTSGAEPANTNDDPVVGHRTEEELNSTQTGHLSS